MHWHERKRSGSSITTRYDKGADWCSLWVWNEMRKVSEEEELFLFFISKKEEERNRRNKNE